MIEKWLKASFKRRIRKLFLENESQNVNRFFHLPREENVEMEIACMHNEKAQIFAFEMENLL
jgi:hypothetical protein